MKNRFFCFLLVIASCFTMQAQDIPQHISYTRIYEFMDELANEGLFELNSAIKPYSRAFIAEKLLEAQNQSEKLNRRQKKELKFFLNEYALEQHVLPEGYVDFIHTNQWEVALGQPAIHHNGENFRARITPLLGMHIDMNGNGTITKRWYGAEFQAIIGKGLTIFGSLRDISIRTPFEYGMLSQPNYLVNLPGYEYKETSNTKGGDYSDSRGGIKYAWDWGSFGLVKDNVEWGDNYNGSNILSGRAPSFPMITLNVKPARWFELNYFHGWLVSNVVDSTKYYLENEITKHYRQANKFMAANMMTFVPLRNLHLSLGNAIVYAENNVQAAYFIPIAFYKSIDHTLTKGTKQENQNSMMFFNISSRNIKHLHLYASVFVDEFNFSRLKKSNKEANPISYKLGGRLSNFPIQNLSLTGEFTHTNIINYKHSIPQLTWASNSYNLGHYLGDNAQEIYVALKYKPIRGLDVNLSYLNAKHGKEYAYVRRADWNGINGNILGIISQPSLGEIIWTNQTLGLNVIYEVFNNAYAIVNVAYSNIQGHENGDAQQYGESKMTADEVLKYYTPEFLRGKNTTIMIGFSFGF